MQNIFRQRSTLRARAFKIEDMTEDLKRSMEKHFLPTIKFTCTHLELKAQLMTYKAATLCGHTTALELKIKPALENVKAATLCGHTTALELEDQHLYLHLNLKIKPPLENVKAATLCGHTTALERKRLAQSAMNTEFKAHNSWIWPLEDTQLHPNHTFAVRTHVFS